ncbi:unnamed protein product [Angiostrongylus costaricensis]|uniref:Glutaredoxin domain-containing protein n=1 Tax=Angiostrongylus costaricensis TaxID=334426 RepID=A0A0R3PA75_ANGCS|nr:unnamed protein product [Angiostrongylus costaricensis]
MDELNDDGILYVERNINDAMTAQNKKRLVDLTKCRTLPQIFVCGRFLCGYTELEAHRPDLIEQCSNDGVTFKPGIDIVASKI